MESPAWTWFGRLRELRIQSISNTDDGETYEE